MKSKAKELFPMTVWLWRDENDRFHIVDPDKLNEGIEVSKYKFVSTGTISRSVSIIKRKNVGE